MTLETNNQYVFNAQLHLNKNFENNELKAINREVEKTMVTQEPIENPFNIYNDIYYQMQIIMDGNTNKVYNGIYQQVDYRLFTTIGFARFQNVNGVYLFFDYWSSGSTGRWYLMKETSTYMDYMLSNCLNYMCLFYQSIVSMNIQPEAIQYWESYPEKDVEYMSQRILYAPTFVLNNTNLQDIKYFIIAHSTTRELIDQCFYELKNDININNLITVGCNDIDSMVQLFINKELVYQLSYNDHQDAVKKLLENTCAKFIINIYHPGENNITISYQTNKKEISEYLWLNRFTEILSKPINWIWHYTLYWEQIISINDNINAIMYPQLDSYNYYYQMNKFLVYYPFLILMFFNINILTYQYCYGYYEYYYNIKALQLLNGYYLDYTRYYQLTDYDSSQLLSNKWKNLQKSIGLNRLIFAAFTPFIMYVIILALNLIPDIGIKIYSTILHKNLQTLIKINLTDLGISPYIFALGLQILTPWLLILVIEQNKTSLRLLKLWEKIVPYELIINIFTTLFNSFPLIILLIYLMIEMITQVGYNHQVINGSDDLKYVSYMMKYNFPCLLAQFLYDSTDSLQYFYCLQQQCYYINDTEIGVQECNKRVSYFFI